MATRRGRRTSRPRRVIVRLGLAFAGLCAGLIAAELVLAALGRPRFHAAHETQPEGRFRVHTEEDPPMYVNVPSTYITFVYDSNPRGYFGSYNDVAHRTNELGFRARREFSQTKDPNTFRLIFLGDSLTFGEGVRFDDTYPEHTATLLRAESKFAKLKIEALNFGVGGYNTAQSLEILRRLALAYEPDVVVLGYTLNDAEPPLIIVDPATGQVRRRDRERHIPEGRDDPRPPPRLIYKLRLASAVWQALSNRERTRQTVTYYRSLYEDGSPGWVESRRALRETIALCEKNDVLCCVVCFPILHELSNSYPFADIHEKVCATAREAGAIVVDLFPELKGEDAASLWVHPTDPHPNERVHAVAAAAIARALVASHTP